MSRASFPTVAVVPALLISLANAPAVHAQAPVAVSPGSPTGSSPADRCSTFSWGAFDRAVAYELAVYHLDGGQEVESEPVLAQRIPGAALSWTPSPDRCPARGERFAWSVRAVVPEGVSEWSAPMLFEVSEPPSDQELAWALEVVRRHFAEELPDGPPLADAAPRSVDEVHEIESGSARPEVGSELRPRGAREPEASGTIKLASLVVAAGSPTAHVKVAGEVRTIDPGAPNGPARLWGRGRMDAEVHGRATPFGAQPCVDGSIRFGLSTVAVDWGSAADACPAGTWVCRLSEKIHCDTLRPDTSVDGLHCDGTPFDASADQHLGWVAEASSAETNGLASAEVSGLFSSPTCWTLPVWCCWE